jgi:polysaccharide pyruvyl transferase WcaK-like protein
MEYAGRYSVADPKDATFHSYLDSMAGLAEWLLANGYDARLLIGDLTDIPVIEQFKAQLASRIQNCDPARIIDQPVSCVDDLLTQLASTDLVVATRFHNALLALLVGKPTLEISFHHKCASLMKQMEVSEYCLDIDNLSADALIKRFIKLEKNSEEIRGKLRQRAIAFRRELDEQYREIGRVIGTGKGQGSFDRSAEWEEVSGR